ncbi:MAG: peptidoglycan-associated lipoprotein Pal [bacterium]
MNHRSAYARMLIFTFAVAVFGTACSRTGTRNHWWEFWKPKAPQVGSIYPSATPLPPPPDVVASRAPGDVSTLPMDGTGIPASEPLRTDPRGSVPALQTVYFDYDSAALGDASIAALDGNSQWITSNPGVQISVEGHCDERGTVEYNYNLGQQRADAAREHIASKGVDANMLHTISYGEDRPVDTGHDDTAWAKNRRVQFLVY